MAVPRRLGRKKVHNNAFDGGDSAGPLVNTYTLNATGVTPTRTGVVTIPFTAANQSAYFNWATNTLEQSVAVKIKLSEVPVGNEYHYELWLRSDGSNNAYIVDGEVTAAGAIDARLYRLVGGSLTSISSRTNLVTGIVANTDYYLRFETTGVGTTKFRARSWLPSDPEHNSWTIDITDTVGPQVAGATSWGWYSDSAPASNIPYNVIFDNFSVNTAIPEEFDDDEEFAASLFFF